MVYIQAKSLKEYEEFIETIKDFIKDREEMIKGIDDRISRYSDRSVTAQGDYKEYCEKILKEEKELFDDINTQLNNAKSFQEELVKSYEKAKLTMN